MKRVLILILALGFVGSNAYGAPTASIAPTTGGTVGVHCYVQTPGTSGADTTTLGSSNSFSSDISTGRAGSAISQEIAFKVDATSSYVLSLASQGNNLATGNLSGTWSDPTYSLDSGANGAQSAVAADYSTDKAHTLKIEASALKSFASGLSYQITTNLICTAS
jgi:hypothetical protein